MSKFLSFPPRHRLAALTALVTVHASPFAQVPVTQVQPNLPSPIIGLPPGPTVTNWQPRGRAVIGGTIVVTGSNFRPAEFIAVIGSAKFKLPVRLATSTATRIEIAVPDEALGKLGTLAVGYATTQGTVLETSYRIDPPAPAIVEANAGAPVTPFLKRVLEVRIREFPGAKVNADNITFGGTCGFRKRSGVGYGTVNRQDDLTLRIAIEGWFENAGNCQLQVNMSPQTETGINTGSIQLTTPFTVAAPQRYVFDNTASLTSKLQTSLVHFGVGNICEGSNTGVTPSGNDFAVVSRGGPLDVECVFQTQAWLLPPGVRLAEIAWRDLSTGNRCGLYGTFSHTFPGVRFTFARGGVIVKPKNNQPVSDFFAFGESSIVSDGVSFASNLNGPRTLVKFFSIGIQCVSMATVLTTSQGTFGPTTSPQAYAIILDRVVFEGPPGLSTADILR